MSTYTVSPEHSQPPEQRKAARHSQRRQDGPSLRLGNVGRGTAPEISRCGQKAQEGPLRKGHGRRIGVSAFTVLKVKKAM